MRYVRRAGPEDGCEERDVTDLNGKPHEKIIKNY
jgi:hypothetical protein